MVKSTKIGGKNSRNFVSDFEQNRAYLEQKREHNSPRFDHKNRLRFCPKIRTKSATQTERFDAQKFAILQ